MSPTATERVSALMTCLCVATAMTGWIELAGGARG